MGVAQRPRAHHRALGLGSIEHLTDDEWIDTVDLGASATSAACAPRSRCSAAEWARIVNVSATSTKRQPAPDRLHRGQGACSRASPRTCRSTLAPEEILVNTVSPGSFATEVQGLRPRMSASTPTTSTPSCGPSTSTSATPPSCPAPVTPPRSDRSSRSPRRPELLHDRRQHQRRRRHRLLLSQRAVTTASTHAVMRRHSSWRPAARFWQWPLSARTYRARSWHAVNAAAVPR